MLQKTVNKLVEDDCSIGKVLIAAATACIIPRAIFWVRPMNRYLTLIISAVIGVVVYLLAVKLLKVNEINDLVGLLKRKMKRA